MHKRVVEQCKQEMRLAGSLPPRIGLLVLTRTMHTHGKKKKKGIREMYEGDIEARSD